MGRENELGDYETISEVGQKSRREKAEKQKAAPPAPAERPKQTEPIDPGPKHDEVIDEFKVEEMGRKSLPDEAALIDFMNRAASGQFAELAAQVTQGSGLVTDDFAARLRRALEKMADAETLLNQKKVPERDEPEAGDREPLPGVIPDDVCTSVFDVDDLALRGSKAVTVRRYQQPLVLHDAFVGKPKGLRGWLFGQKLEYQQEWRHRGFTLGDLISSISLLPAEELTLEVSSWQRTKTEISEEKDETTRRLMENEQRNSDVQTCTNATASSFGWSVSASGGVSYPVASASVSASASGSTSSQAERTSESIREATTAATQEVSARRAVKMTQTSEAGSESTTTRRIRNPNTCHTVSFNFFQIVKLYDVQMRLMAAAPLLLLPGIFPRFYGSDESRQGKTEAPPTEVQIPYFVLEGWRAPAVFLMQYFDIDRDLSEEMSGWALRFRFEIALDPVVALQQFAEGLVVATLYLLKEDPAQQLARLSQLLRQYADGTLQLYEQAAEQYGTDKGRTEQVNTPGIYVDALRGRCTACEDYAEASRYVDVMRQQEEIVQLRQNRKLVEHEATRREQLLAGNHLDPFQPSGDHPLRVDLVGGGNPQ